MKIKHKNLLFQVVI